MSRLSKIGAACLAAFGWTSGVSAVSASYLVVAGGGGGASQRGGGGSGGGGAGGFRSGTASLNPTLSYTVTVGGGGTGPAGGNPEVDGGIGSNSVFNAVTSTGGGGGGKSATNGTSGGSGGGGGSTTGTGGAGTSGQGNTGGNGGNYSGGGGGGANAVGGSWNGSNGSNNGGNGLANTITGSTTGQLSSGTYYLAGGGGGGVEDYGARPNSSGGLGGGGAGVSGNPGNGVSGTANTGGGGGGASGSNANPGNGGAGGSGVVVISYPAPQQFGGGVVTTSGSNVIHTFTTSGTLSPLSSLTASYAIVAGGGAGGQNGGAGGGAGGFLSGTGLTIDTNSNYLVTVGAGGATTTNAVIAGSGTNSVFSMVTTAAVGGGGAGTYNTINGANGGSGGGGGGTGGGTSSGGTGTSGQGYAGGGGIYAAGRNPAGGGGGAGGVGATATGTGISNATGGAGGVGLANPITGSTAGQLVSTTYYLAGGGGGSGDFGSVGGNGGGGLGTSNAGTTGTAGTANTGGGGGGTFNNYTAGAGGSGVVIIAYAGSTQQMAGGTVTISGGNVIHTFTSSGYLTPIKYVNNSLRFRASATAYLNRTFTTPTNQKIWTWSGWLKRGALANGWFFGAGGTSNPREGFQFLSDNTLDFTTNTGGAIIYEITSTQVFRDPSAWYHIIIAFDSTQATASNRIKLYVNGTQVTALNAASYPSLNSNPEFINSSGTIHNIGALPNGTGPFDGYLTEINFIDGQALTPNSFGTFNSYGVWQPITYGGSYGNNGFYLPFTNKTSTTTLGYDFSPQGNNWTPSAGISLTAGATYDSMTDVPTLTSATAANYCVLSPLWPSSIVSGGNLNIVGDSNSRTVVGSIVATTGKWYAEGTFTSGYSVNGWFFVWDTSTPYVYGNLPSTTGQTGAYYRGTDGNISKSVTGTTTSIGTYSTWTNGDIIGMAFDADAGTISSTKIILCK